jgi:hypothetical protein
MSDEPTKKPPEEPPAKYKPVEGGTYRGYDPNDPFRTRDPANRKRHQPRNQVAEGTDDNPLDW